MKKQDKQGVRTAPELEQKYAFGSDKKAITELKKSLSAFLTSLSDMRTRITELAGEIKDEKKRIRYAELVSSGTSFTLSDCSFDDIVSVLDKSGIVVLYMANQDSVRYYTVSKKTDAMILFRYTEGKEAEEVMIGSDGTITVNTITYTMTDEERTRIVEEVLAAIKSTEPSEGENTDGT